MKINNFVAAEEVISALNVEPPSLAEYCQFLMRYAAGAHLEAPEDLIRSIREYLELESLKTTRGRRSWFISNYLVQEITIVAPSLSTEKGWRLPDTVTTEESWHSGRPRLFSRRCSAAMERARSPRFFYRSDPNRPEALRWRFGQ